MFRPTHLPDPVKLAKERQLSQFETPLQHILAYLSSEDFAKWITMLNQSGQTAVGIYGRIANALLRSNPTQSEMLLRALLEFVGDSERTWKAPELHQALVHLVPRATLSRAWTPVLAHVSPFFRLTEETEGSLRDGKSFEWEELTLHWDIAPAHGAPAKE